MKLSLSIMGVPQRAGHIQKMTSRLRDQILQAQRTGFDVDGTSVYYDQNMMGPWHSWQGAWRTHEDYGSTHHVVLQDDLLFCKDLPATLCRMAEARPRDFISGFLPRKSTATAYAQGVPWVRTRRFLWAQCCLLPVELGDSILEWARVREHENPSWKRDDDVRIAAFLKAHKLPVYVGVPHPIEHIGDELGSVMRHNFSPKRRRAKAWIGEGDSGLEVNWSNLAFIRE